MDVEGDQPPQDVQRPEAAAPVPESEPAPQAPFVIADDPGASVDLPPDDELSGQRIAQISKLRRAAYRSRSHAIIGLVCCIVMIGQLVWVAVQNWQAGDYVFAAISAVMGVALVWLAVWCTRLAVRLHRQATAPTSTIQRGFEPDFSPLSDGSQRWKNLEKIK
jgi:uncharacterized membrane protein YcjF (UPF0283 family)